MSETNIDDMDLITLVKSVRACSICADLPLGPNPILQISETAKILIVGQAPGRITHNKNVPFDDPSGVRLRQWMGITKDIFYDDQKIAILPMGFCFPGSDKGGDLPPRPECAKTWRDAILSKIPNCEMTLIMGQYAINWHIKDNRKVSLTQRVSEWKTNFPTQIILPHPSPRNNRWLKRNPWFEADVIPALQREIAKLLG